MIKFHTNILIKGDSFIKNPLVIFINCLVYCLFFLRSNKAIEKTSALLEAIAMIIIIELLFASLESKNDPEAAETN